MENNNPPEKEEQPPEQPVKNPAPDTGGTRAPVVDPDAQKKEISN